MSAPLPEGSAGEPPSPASRRGLALHGPRLLLGLAVAVLTWLLFPASPAADVPIYDVGAVANDNVIAPFGFVVRKNEEELERERTELTRAAEPVFRYVPAALDSARGSLRAFRGAVEAAVVGDPRGVPARVQHAAAQFGVQIPLDQAAYLAVADRRAALLGALERVIERWMAPGVAASTALDQVRGQILLRRGRDEVRIPSDSVLTFSMLVSRARLLHPDPRSPAGDALYLRLLGAFFHPTIVLDAPATQLRLDELRRSVPTAKYEVQAGEKIIGANEVVGRDEHEKLRALSGALELRRGSELRVRRVVGALLVNLLLLGLLGWSVALFRPGVYRQMRSMGVMAAVIGAVILVSALVARGRPPHPELVPIAFVAVILSALFEQRLSVLAAVVVSVLIGIQAPYRGTNALLIGLIGGVVAAVSVRVALRRHTSFRWILNTALAYAITAVAIGWGLDLPTGEILASAAWGTLNAAASVVLAIQLLPLAEQFTGIETDLTLLEWSDLNRPLMQRLSLEAPGTYAHTIAMANLAEAACRAIGANALLARVGAYYHDIGKLSTPQYFVENQRRGGNPHDQLTPAASASIIKDHVLAGLALAERHGLPRALRPFILEHHGTAAISYFLEKARERDPDHANPREYEYPGPRPRSAETAVVMLADGVEASVRVLADPDTSTIRDVVDHIVKQRMDQGQLQEAPLTLAQIEQVKAAFVRTLSGMYHGRIDYPVASGGVTSEFAAR